MTPTSTAQVAVAYRGVTFSYPRAGIGEPAALRPALQNVTLDVHAGERLGILGPNGGGKSTLLKLTLGLLTGYSGEISIFGMTPEESRRRAIVGYVPQRPQVELGFPVNVREVVAMAACVNVPAWRSPSGDQRRAVDEAISVVGAAEFADRPVGKISGDRKSVV